MKQTVKIVDDVIDNITIGFFVLIGLGLGLLYIYALFTWLLENLKTPFYTALFLSLCFVIGYGLQKLSIRSIPTEKP